MPHVIWSIMWTTNNAKLRANKRIEQLVNDERIPSRYRKRLENHLRTVSFFFPSKQDSDSRLNYSTTQWALQGNASGVPQHEDGDCGGAYWRKSRSGRTSSKLIPWHGIPRFCMLIIMLPRRQGQWFKVRGRIPTDDPAIHACTIAYASDSGILMTALRANGLVSGRRIGMMTSLDHSVWFHAPTRADEW